MIYKSLFNYSLLLALTFNPLDTLATEESSYEITSDSSTQDFSNQIIIYKGNAIFSTGLTTVKGDEIRAYSDTQETKNVRITGNSAQLSQYHKALKQFIQLSADTINYNLKSKSIKALNNIIIFQKTTDSANIVTPKNNNENYFKAEGQELNLSSSPQSILVMSGNPVKITIGHPNQAPLKIEANRMVYDQIEQQFQLIGNVLVLTGREKINTAKVLYNRKTRVLQLPETEGQRVKMIQTVKGSHE